MCIWIGAIPPLNQLSPWLTGIKSGVPPMNLPSRWGGACVHLISDEITVLQGCVLMCVHAKHPHWGQRLVFALFVFLLSPAWRRTSEGQIQNQETRFLLQKGGNSLLQIQRLLSLFPKMKKMLSEGKTVTMK